MKIRIGSRKSKLAVTQAKWVADCLKGKQTDLDIEFVGIATQGDQQADAALNVIGGKGVFVKEIEDALLKNEIDLAVHSLKDVPQMLPSGLTLAAFPKREDPRDAVISRFGEYLRELPRGSVVGTSSPRRASQIKFNYKNRYRIEPIRGNVDTRLKKLQNGDYDVIVMATAGLKRLGLEGEITQILEVDELMPAPGQGCLGLEIRSEDEKMAELVSSIKDSDSDIVARAERAFLQGCGGDCNVPLAGFGKIENQNIKMNGMILDLDGTKKIEVSETGTVKDAELVGAKAAGRLLKEGGSAILMKS